MSEYRIIILISDKKISALDISEKNNIEKISIEGNENMPYKSEKDMAVFCDYIRSYYNIDEFSDIDLSVSIVKLNAGMEYIRSLVEEINKAKEYNLINIESILPLLMLKEQKVKANSSHELEIFGEGYRLFVDQEWNIQVEKVSLSEKKIVLDEEKLVVFGDWNVEGLIGSEDELSALKELNKKEIENRDKIIKNLEKELEKERQKGESIRKNLENKIEKLEKEKAEKEKKEGRYICKFELMGRQGENKSYFKESGYIRFIENIVYDGDIVDEKKEIAICHIKSRGRWSVINKDISIKAKAKGRIFFLKKDREGLELNEHIAIIGNLSDTKEDVMEWYRKLQ